MFIVSFLQFFNVFAKGIYLFAFLFGLQHPFITRATDAKPVRDLVAEFKAEVVEEVTEDDLAEVIMFLSFCS